MGRDNEKGRKSVKNIVICFFKKFLIYLLSILVIFIKLFKGSKNMIIGIGADIEEIKRFKDNYRKKHFLDLLFSQKEKEYCKNKKEPYISLAGKFCAKEAVIKAYKKEISIKHIEILNSKSGKVEVFINGKIDKNIHCTISHTKKYAIAFVVIEQD